MSGNKIVLIIVHAIGASALSTPGLGQNKNFDQAFGYLFPEGSCPQAAYALTPCPCTPPIINH